MRGGGRKGGGKKGGEGRGSGSPASRNVWGGRAVGEKGRVDRHRRACHCLDEREVFLLKGKGGSIGRGPSQGGNLLIKHLA